MSVTINAATLSIISSHQLQQEIDNCKITIDKFDNRTSTISEKQEYSRCVDTIYPKNVDINPDIMLGLEFIFWFLVLMPILGAINGIRTGTSLMDNALYWFLKGFLTVMILVLMVSIFTIVMNGG